MKGLVIGMSSHKKTGLIVTEENIDLLTPEEIEEFEMAMDEEGL